MKILHIAPCISFNDTWAYQENLLPKYHKLLGHDVTVIATNTVMNTDNRIVETDCDDYTLDNGVRIIRLPRKKYFHSSLTMLNSYVEVYDKLVELKPDFVFLHGLVTLTIFDIIKYKKKINPDCVIVQDNHLDYNIGKPFKTFKQRVVRAIHRYINKKSIPYVDRVYGVTPWRKTYAEDYFKIPSDKTDVLIMGADDDKINFAERDSIRKSIRQKYGIADDDFFIVTGGKIDKKKKIEILMKACQNEEKVKLLVFGSVLNDVKDEFDSILKASDNIEFIGWIDADAVYDYFFAADLVFFPGQHSVLWEQACAAKAVCVFEKWEGMDHVNNGGNSDFVFPVTVENVKEKIRELKFTEKYALMKSVAESDNTKVYLYSHIANKCLEDVYKK